MDAQRGLSVSGHRNTVLCLHLTSDTYHVTPSGRAPRARGKFWIRRVKLRIFRPDPKSHKSEGFPAAQIFKTHKCQNTYCRSAHFSKAVKIVGAQNPRGTTCSAPQEDSGRRRADSGRSGRLGPPRVNVWLKRLDRPGDNLTRPGHPGPTQDVPRPPRSQSAARSAQEKRRRT